MHAPRRLTREPARCTVIRDRRLRRHGLIYRGLCDLVLDEHGHCPTHDPR